MHTSWGAVMAAQREQDMNMAQARLPHDAALADKFLLQRADHKLAEDSSLYDLAHTESCASKQHLGGALGMQTQTVRSV